jgi:hypothetical protein
MKRMRTSLILKGALLLFLLLIGRESECATLYWYGASSTTFSTAANWSTTSGSYTASASAPGSADVANFGNYTGMTNVNCNITSAINVAGIVLNTGYTGTVNANTGSLTHTIGSSGLVINAGTFTISQSVTVNNSGVLTIAGGTFSISQGNTTVSNTGNLTISSGTFSVSLTSAVTVTCSTSGNFNQTGGTFSSSSYSGSTVNINIAGDMTSSSGTFTAGNSTFKLTKSTASCTLTGSPTFNNLTFFPTSAATWSIASSPTVNGLLQYSGTVTITLNTGTINAKGDITIANTLPSGGGGNATININGSNPQHLTGNAAAGNGLLPNINVACGTLRVLGTPSVLGNWVYSSGTVDCNYSSSNSTIAFYGTGDIDGQGSSATMTFQNISINASGTTPVRTLKGNLIVNKNLTINSGITLATGVSSSVAYNINISGNWTDAGTFSQIATPSCTVTFEGSNYTAISRSSGTESFTNLTVNKSGSGVSLSCPVDVTGTVTLSSGKVKTTTTNILHVKPGATVSGGSNTAYVNGPMKKTGNTAFVFPIGDSAVASTPYHPLGITAPGNAGDSYMAQYKGSGQTYGTSLASTLASISSCEHWLLKCAALGSSSSSVTPTINWNANCNNVNYSEMVVGAWNGSTWTDLGAGTVNGTAPAGSISSSTALTYTNTTTVTPLVIAKKLVVQSYATLSKQPTGGYYNTNGNVLYFRYDEEYNDNNGLVNYQIINMSTNSTVTLYSNPSTTNVPVVYGTNLYKMDLYSAANTPISSGMYLLIITNDKNETFQLMFNKN